MQMMIHMKLAGWYGSTVTIVLVSIHQHILCNRIRKLSGYNTFLRATAVYVSVISGAIMQNAKFRVYRRELKVHRNE